MPFRSSIIILADIFHVHYHVICQVAVIYMCTRLINNLIQAYTPLYLIESLNLTKVSDLPFPLLAVTLCVLFEYRSV